MGSADESDWLPLCAADSSELESELVQLALHAASWSSGPLVRRFEDGFAHLHERAHGISVASGTLGTWLALRALGIGAGDEVIASAYGWQPVANAVALAGARVVHADIDYWSGCLDAARAAPLITPATRALIGGNVNGHPADWDGLRALATEHGLALIEDSTEAIGSRRSGRPVGRFGDVSVFDFAAPSVLQCGSGGMLLTDDAALATELRRLRGSANEDGHVVPAGTRVPTQAGIGEITAALGLAQLARLPEILERRKAVEAAYLREMLSFEGIKPPYLAPGVDEVHWMLYVVHLGKRFGGSAVAQIVEDLRTAGIDCAPYSRLLHRQPSDASPAWQRGRLPLAERIAECALALPLHGGLTQDQVRFIVKTLKDSSVNVGAGAAIY